MADKIDLDVPPTRTERMITAKERLLNKFRRIAPRRGNRAERLPPGQYRVTRFPVLDLGIHPPFDPATWRLRVDGAVANPLEFTWEEFRALPKVEQVTDFHCVTTWSTYDLRWGGVAFATIVELARPAAEATHLMQHCADDYTTNLPLAELGGPRIMLAYELNGEPLPLAHGGPMRLVVPHLYAWKSAKFLNRLEFMTHDRKGFWEERGYHDVGDPWTEQRLR